MVTIRALTLVTKRNTAQNCAILEDYIPVTPNFRRVLLLLTNRCNLSCKHCYVASSPNGTYGLSTKRAISLLDEVYDQLGNVSISLSGGEALTRRSDTRSILEHSTKRFTTWLLTNGTLLNKDDCALLKDLRVIVRLSLDGATPETHDYLRGAGAYKRLCKGIDQLHAVGYPLEDIHLFCTIAPENISAIDGVINFAKRFGISHIKFEPVCKTGRALENWAGRANYTPDPDTAAYRQYFPSEFLKHHGAEWRLKDLESTELSWATLNIYYDGAVYPYTYTDDIDRQAGYLGNINTESLSNVLETRKVSRAIVSKLIMFSRYPVRSLCAYCAERKVI